MPCCGAEGRSEARYCTACGKPMRRQSAPPMKAWLAFPVALCAGAMVGSVLLFSMGISGTGDRAAVIGGAVAGAAAVVVMSWGLWARWWVAQQRARRHSAQRIHRFWAARTRVRRRARPSLGVAVAGRRRPPCRLPEHAVVASSPSPPTSSSPSPPTCRGNSHVRPSVRRRRPARSARSAPRRWQWMSTPTGRPAPGLDRVVPAASRIHPAPGGV